MDILPLKYPFHEAIKQIIVILRNVWLFVWVPCD